MRVRKIRRKCGVRGCRNTESFMISRTHEVGNSVIICKKCLQDTLEATKDYKETPKPKSTGEPPKLFYNSVKAPEKEAKPPQEAPEPVAPEKTATEPKKTAKKKG